MPIEAILENLDKLPSTALGVISLGIILIGGICYYFFKDAPTIYRMVAFVLLIVGFGLLVAVLSGGLGNGDDGLSKPQSKVPDVPRSDVEGPEPAAIDCDNSDLVCLTKKLESKDAN